MSEKVSIDPDYIVITFPDQNDDFSLMEEYLDEHKNLVNDKKYKLVGYFNKEFRAYSRLTEEQIHQEIEREAKKIGLEESGNFKSKEYRFYQQWYDKEFEKRFFTQRSDSEKKKQDSLLKTIKENIKKDDEFVLYQGNVNLFLQTLVPMLNGRFGDEFMYVHTHQNEISYVSDDQNKILLVRYFYY